MAALTAPYVSKTLRAAGFGIVATRNREGIRVSRGGLVGRVCVVVDMDRPGEAKRAAETLQRWLETQGRTLGWDYSKAEGEDGFFTVFHKPLPKADPAAHLPLLGEDHLVARAVADMEAGKVVSFNTEPVLVAQKPLQPWQGDQARELSLQVRTATLALENSVRGSRPPAQADITAARTALEALIELAGGDQ